MCSCFLLDIKHCASHFLVLNWYLIEILHSCAYSVLYTCIVNCDPSLFVNYLSWNLYCMLLFSTKCT